MFRRRIVRREIVLVYHPLMLIIQFSVEIRFSGSQRRHLTEENQRGRNVHRVCRMTFLFSHIVIAAAIHNGVA